MFHIVYKTVNTVNGKYYIGKHKQKHLEFDGYYGSGTAINNAVSKYGRHYFNREILFVSTDEQEAYNKEKELLKNIWFLEENYNLAPGGSGGAGKEGNSVGDKISKGLEGVEYERYSPGKHITDTHWWNNGTTHIRSSSCPGKDWSKGRLEEGHTKTLNSTKLECPHCGKINNVGNAKRWHFDNCKAIRSTGVTS